MHYVSRETCTDEAHHHSFITTGLKSAAETRLKKKNWDNDEVSKSELSQAERAVQFVIRWTNRAIETNVSRETCREFIYEFAYGRKCNEFVNGNRLR